MLTLLTLLTLSAAAQPAPAEATPSARVERLADALELGPEVAEEVAALVEAHRTEKMAHREAVKSTAQALNQAREAGDRKAMKRGIAEMNRLRDRGRELNDRHHDDVMDLLDVEQQARWVLLQVRRHARRQSGGLPHHPR